MRFRALDHVGFVVSDIDAAIDWWTMFLEEEPFASGTFRADEIEDFVGRIVGYQDCDLSAAFWSLPGGTVLELLAYQNPTMARVDMESYNIGNAHLCLETPDIDAEFERLKGRAECRSEGPVTAPLGPLKGSRICYVRNPDGITIELIQFPEGGRAFQEPSPFADPYGDSASSGDAERSS